jgi:glutathione S-transferase
MTSNKTPYKLIYFNLRWLGEPIRYLLSYAGEEFEEIRLDWDDWEAGKIDKTVYRYSKLPILEDRSGTEVASFSQSFSILKYLGKKYDLGGKDLLEEAKCDEFSDCMKDILKEVEEMFTEDQKRKSKLRATLLSLTIPRYWSVFEEELKARKNAGAGTPGTLPLVGDKVTWVDFQLAHFSELFEQFFMNKHNLPEVADKADGGQGLLLDAYPLIREHQKWVNGLKGVREWRAKRPVTEY